jgi:hypothetical protein
MYEYRFIMPGVDCVVQDMYAYMSTGIIISLDSIVYHQYIYTYIYIYISMQLCILALYCIVFHIHVLAHMHEYRFHSRS